MSIKVKILDKRILEEHLVPSTQGSAAIDLRACIATKTRILPNQTLLVKTGLSVFIKDKDKAGLIVPRSGLGSKGLVIGNLTGLIDSDYQGELSVSLWNRTESPIDVAPLDRVAQLFIVPIVTPDYEVVKSFDEETERGENGYGSTGKN